MKPYHFKVYIIMIL